ncbi:acyl-CoA thioesterase [Frondihabitans cladoniiphilus]|uniref:Thioesterase family protein n=1 Tax=Frondihabitans cladoniiphilus TaxID=715785 RepID=A0ABP8WCE6_9MICO
MSGYEYTFASRWNDNDVYGHLNNAVYNQAMDTTINTWLVEEAGFDLMAGDPLALCVSSSCQFRASASFPERIVVELQVAKIGNSSVVWTPRILRESNRELLVDGEFVSVYVDRQTRRPVPVPASIRDSLAATFAVPAP